MVSPDEPVSPELLRADGLNVQRDGIERLRDISFTLHGAEILAVIGPNGAGKTTLLQTLIADLTPTSGSIHLADKPLAVGTPTLRKLAVGTPSVNSYRDTHRNGDRNNPDTHVSHGYPDTHPKAIWTPTARARHLAILPQTSPLNFPFTVREVIALGRTPHSSGWRVDGEVVEATMDLMDITHLADQFYTHLSGGEKQRTQLARVLTQIWRAEDASPRLLILDEPTSSLDLGHKQQLMAAIRRFAAQGDVGVLIVEHDLAVVANYATTVLALREGQCEALGPTAAVLDQVLVQRLFGADIQVCVDQQSGKICVGV